MSKQNANGLVVAVALDAAKAALVATNNTAVEKALANLEAAKAALVETVDLQAAIAEAEEILLAEHAAKEKAETLLDLWKSGKADEESFIELAMEHNTDPGSKENGGLYEDVYPGQMVEAFEEWCFHADRKPGDTGVVETEYGYHVMYYKEDGELSYRDFMIDNVLTNEAFEAWEKSLTDKVTTEDINLSGMETDYVIAG